MWSISFPSSADNDLLVSNDDLPRVNRYADEDL